MSVMWNVNFNDCLLSFLLSIPILAKKYRANRYNIATTILTECGHIVSLGSLWLNIPAHNDVIKGDLTRCSSQTNSEKIWVQETSSLTYIKLCYFTDATNALLKSVMTKDTTLPGLKKAL